MDRFQTGNATARTSRGPNLINFRTFFEPGLDLNVGLEDSREASLQCNFTEHRRACGCTCPLSLRSFALQTKTNQTLSIKILVRTSLGRSWSIGTRMPSRSVEKNYVSELHWTLTPKQTSLRLKRLREQLENLMDKQKSIDFDSYTGCKDSFSR